MSRVTTMLFLMVLVAAAFAWIGTVGSALSLHQSDNAGNGLSYGFAMIGAIITWALLAVLLIIGFLHVARPAWAPVLAAVGLVASGVAAFTVVNLLKDDAHFPAQWPIVALVLPPLLIMSFAAWAAFPAVQRVAEPRLMFASLWGVVLALSALPFPLRVAQNKRLATQRVAYSQTITDRDSNEKVLAQKELAALTDTSALSEYLALTTHSTEVRELALERARALPNRQRDAVTMLNAREDVAMGELRNLGLEPTAELCQASVEFLHQDAVAHRNKRGNYNGRFVAAAQDLDKFLFGMQWLAERRCDVTQAVNAYKETALLYPDSPERAAFLARIESFVQQARSPAGNK